MSMLMFAYGMNTNLDQMAARCPAAKCLGPATLPGYRLRFAGCADIVEDRTSVVNGVLWMITEDCLAALDILEGYPVYYNSDQFEVEYNDGIVLAEAYFMTPGNADHPPSDGYFEIVREGYIQNGIPTTQIDSLRNRVDSFDSFLYN